MSRERLRELRKTGDRRSAEVVELAEGMFDKGEVKRLGDELWVFLEQVAVAAMDVGKIALAEMCVGRLDKRFEGSPRVLPLKGMLLEAKGELEPARRLYEDELQKPVDTKKASSTGEANLRIRRRLIALHLHHGSDSSADSLSVEKGIDMMVKHLDGVYNDPEGWLELAEAYAKLGMYAQSIAALEDLILLQPYNPYHLLRLAETLYTAGDYLLAYKTFLRVIEASGKVSDQSKGGPSRRAAFGAKLCVPHLDNLPNAPARVGDVEDMLNEELLKGYSRDWVPLKGLRVASESCLKALRSWLEATA